MVSLTITCERAIANVTQGRFGGKRNGRPVGLVHAGLAQSSERGAVRIAIVDGALPCILARRDLLPKTREAAAPLVLRTTTWRVATKPPAAPACLRPLPRSRADGFNPRALTMVGATCVVAVSAKTVCGLKHG